MKSQYEMMLKAVSIADNDSNACVGVFCDFRDIKDSWKDWTGDGEYTLSTRTYTSNSGGFVMLVKMYQDYNVFEMSGAKFTHIFYQERILMDCDLKFLLSRIRSTKEHPEPMGAYNNWGCVYRTEVW